MKKIFLVAVVFLFAFCNTGFAQFTFSVSPGLNLNSTSFGYKVNKAVPYFVFQFVHLGLEFEDSGYPDDDFEGVVNLYIPNIGIKYLFAEKNKIKAYGNICFTKPIIGGKIKSDNADDEFEEALDNLSLFGFQFGFGTEYFFDENFSLGGEFGFSFMHMKSETSYTKDDYSYNPVTGEYEYSETKETYTVKGNLNPTYSKIVFNYYF